MAEGLDMWITFKAIRDAAIGKGFLTYSELAKAHGANINDEYHPLIAQLNELLKICFKNGWPALPVIVVAEGTEKLTGKNLRAFCNSARKAGYDFRDCEEFADEQRRLIEWAKNADTECSTESDGDEDGNGGKDLERPIKGDEMKAIFDWAQTADVELAIEDDVDKDGTEGKGTKRYKGGHREDGFEIQITYRIIVAAARDRRVVHYTEITDEHGMKWSPAAFSHLGKVLEVSFKRHWPALTAIVVPKNQDCLTKGGLEGFCESARQAGYEFDDCETFAREQMEAVFDWAQTADGEWK